MPADVDAFHDSLTREQLEEYKALSVVDGWYHGRATEADIRAGLHNQTNRLIAFNSSDENAAEKADWKQASDYLTDFQEKPKKKRRGKSVKQVQQELARRHGR